MTPPKLRYAYLSAGEGHSVLVDEIRIPALPGTSFHQLLRRLNVVIVQPESEADGDASMQMGDISPLRN